MKKLWIVFFLAIFVFTLSGCSNSFLDVKRLQSYSENTYYLDLYLDEDKKTLEVKGSIVYVNHQMDLDEIYLTMFPNADNPNRDGYNVTFDNLTINNNAYDVTYSGSDNTSIHLELDETIEEGKNFLIEFEYIFNYWDHGRLYGDGEYFITMFFYPFVSMYDEYGWNIEPYTFNGESYYNDIGDYYVSLNVPNDFLVACSGKLETEEVVQARNQLNYSLDNARDFSFSASSNYFKYTSDLEINSKLITLDIYSITELSNSDLINVTEYSTTSFNIYSDYIGPYDYSHFTLELGNIYGMESTGIAYCSRDINEGTIVHEIIHQWIYSMIGNDQSDFSFIDEALTTFATGIYFYEKFGNIGANQYFAFRESDQVRFNERWLAEENSSMLRKVDGYGENYGFVIYYHGTTLFKHYLDNYLEGDYSVYKSFLQSLYSEYKYEVVTLSEMLELLESTTGVVNTTEWFMDNLLNMRRLSE